MIETAIFLPIFITLLLGVLDFGFLLQQYMVVVDSARAGTQLAMLRNLAVINVSNANLITTMAANSATGIPNYSAAVSNYCTCGPSSAAGSSVTCNSYSVCPGYGPPAQYVKVVATASLPILFGVNGFPATFTVHSTSIVRTPWTGTQ